MKFSIITINYNNLLGLKRTINSVLSQTFRDFEWIIIDGGSNDGSKEEIEALRNNPKANITYWCSERDNGIYHAMNKGIHRSQGEYLNFMNSGDTFYDESTLALVSKLIKGEDIYYGDSLQVYLDHTLMAKAPKQIDLVYMYFRTICQQGMFVKLSVLNSKPFDETFKVKGDSHRWIVSLLDGNSFSYLNLPTCRFYMDGISASGKSYTEEQVMIDQLLKPAIREDLHRLFYYEYSHNYVRLRWLLKKGGFGGWITRLFLKLSYWLFVNKGPLNYDK